MVMENHFILYENIEGSELLNLLKSFSFSDKAEHFVKLDNKTGPLYEWIEKRMNDEKELKYWNIAIPISPSKKKLC